MLGGTPGAGCKDRTRATARLEALQGTRKISKRQFALSLAQLRKRKHGFKSCGLTHLVAVSGFDPSGAPAWMRVACKHAQPRVLLAIPDLAVRSLEQAAFCAWPPGGLQLAPYQQGVCAWQQSRRQRTANPAYFPRPLAKAKRVKP